MASCSAHTHLRLDIEPSVARRTKGRSGSSGTSSKAAGRLTWCSGSSCARAYLQRATALMAADAGSDWRLVKRSTFRLASSRAWHAHHSFVVGDCRKSGPSRSTVNAACAPPAGGMRERSRDLRSDRSRCLTMSCSCAFRRRTSMTLLQYAAYLLLTTVAKPSSWLTTMDTNRSYEAARSCDREACASCRSPKVRIAGTEQSSDASFANSLCAS
mmetsp:Transcript_38434/g.95599  ORF Transcript_38434/g.95599 Transcript_38434/m.95599 type:complete len:214 (-) Transcript_38434:252-893(-)